MSACNKSRHNILLDGLPYNEWQTFSSVGELVRLRAEQLLYDIGTAVRHVYFPTTAVISLLHSMEDGTSIEVASVGREGMVGLPVMTGGNSMPNRVKVQSEGFAYRIQSNEFLFQFDRSRALVDVLFRYMQVLFAQLTQAVACNRHHTVSNQVSRWLLLNFDRSGSDELPIPQQSIADALGVRREGVTQALYQLDLAGAIRRSRRRIELIDRSVLEAVTCECYSVIKGEFDRLDRDVRRI